MDQTYYDSGKYYYTEIATCLEKIDRLTAREYKFSIASLVPTMSSSEEQNNDIKNVSVNNIINESNIDIDDVVVSNNVSIYLPLELMGYCYGEIGLKGDINVSNGSLTATGVIADSIDLSTGKLTLMPPIQLVYGSTITEIGTSKSNFLKETIKKMIMSVSGKLKINTKNSASDIVIEPKNRYIDAGSQWIVTFISGDPTKPAIIARYK